MSDKTEAPTPRRLRRARQEGDSPVSASLTQAFVFVVVLALLPSAFRMIVERVTSRLHEALSFQLADFSPVSLVLDVALLSLPLIVAGAVTAGAVGVAQTGGSVAFKKLAPDLNRANPISGLKNLVRADRLVALARSLAGTLLVAWLATELVLAELASLAAGVGQLIPSAALALVLIKRLAWVAGMLGLALALLDVLAVRYAWFERLRMSKDEVKREYRQAEGDPEVRAARQRAHRELLAGASLNAIRDATVVIVNPTHLATALKYDEGEDRAPQILTQGAGDLARKIVEAAHAYGVPVVRDVPVARALAELEIGDEIPEELYEAVAEILREVFEGEERGSET